MEVIRMGLLGTLYCLTYLVLPYLISHYLPMEGLYLQILPVHTIHVLPLAGIQLATLLSWISVKETIN